MDKVTKHQKDESSAKTGPHKVHMEKWIDSAPFERLLKMEIIEAFDGQATLTMPFYIDFAQGKGLMHGGALVSLADTAVAMAIKSIVPPQTHFGTTNLEVKFFAPVQKGVVTAKAQVIFFKDRILKGEAIIYNDAKKEVMRFLSTFKIAKKALFKIKTY